MKYSIMKWARAGFIISGSLFLIYLSQIPDRLSWANYGVDGGDFLSAILTRGIPHPSGYPTYILLGQLFQLLPFSTPYFRIALLSAISSALASGLLFIILLRIFTDINQRIKTFVAVITAFSWGLNSLTWSQSVIVEVHGLQMLFVILTLFWCLEILQIKSKITGYRFYILILLSVGLGLGLGNHLTLILMLPACLYIIYVALHSGVSWKKILILNLFIFLGTFIYLYLPLLAKNYPPINWGNPQSLNGLIWIISGRIYQTILFQNNIIDILIRISEWARYLINQIGIFGLIIGVFGAIETNNVSRHIRILLLIIFSTYSIFFIVYNTYDAAVYLIPTIMVAVIWIGFGIIYLWQKQIYKIPIGKVFIILYLILFIIKIPQTYNDVNPKRDINASYYAEAYLEYAPTNAIMFTYEDADTFPLWYYHFGLGFRPDVYIIVGSLCKYDWYRQTIEKVYPEIAFSWENTNESVQEIISQLNPDHPVCYSQLNSDARYGIIYNCKPTPK